MTMTTEIPLFCGSCGERQSVRGKIAADLRCRKCGSGDMGLDGVDNAPEMGNGPGQSNVMPQEEGMGQSTGGLTTQARQHLAAPQGPGSGWYQPHPDPLRGWSEYEGPTPQTMPRIPPVADSQTCPVCMGSGYDLIDKAKCRECGGTGVITHPTGRPATLNNDATTQSEPAGGSGWRGASLQSGGFSAEAMSKVAGRPNTKDPYGPEYQNLHTAPGYRNRTAPSGEFDPRDSESFYPSMPNASPHVKTRQDHDYSAPSGPYQMNEAHCPSCGHAPTELKKDRNEDAWWSCPHCGPLANIDKRPEVNPYSPPQGFSPDRSMKTSGFLSRNRKTGRLMKILAAIHQANDLDSPEAVELARKTVARYQER